MTKRQITKHLSEQYKGKKILFGEYDYEITINDTTYHIVFLKIGSSAQLTVNSKTHFEVAYGKRDGIRFIKRSKTLHDFRQFASKKNKIVYLLGKPFRILQYLNESDIIDITGKGNVHDYRLFDNIKDFETLT